VLDALEEVKAFVANGGRKYYFDLRDPGLTKRFENDPKYDGFTYSESADLDENGNALISSFYPPTNLSYKNGESYGVPQHNTLYRVVADKNGRKYLKIEVGNLLRVDGEHKERSAAWTLEIDIETGVVTSLDDGPGPLDSQGFKLAHDKEGKLIKEEERMAVYGRRVVDSLLKGATGDMAKLREKMEEEQRRTGEIRSDIKRQVKEVQ